MKTAYLFLDGFSPEVADIVRKQLLTVGRISSNTGSLACQWQVAASMAQASALLIGDGSQIQPDDLNLPVISPVAEFFTHLKGVKISMPFTAVSLLNALEEVEKLGVAHPDCKDVVEPAIAEEADKPLENTQVEAEAETALSAERAALNETAIQTEKKPARGKLFPLLKYLKSNMDGVFVSWKEGVIWFDRKEKKILSNLSTAAEVAQLLAKETPVGIKSSAVVDVSDFNVFTEDAVLWSYGLRVKPSETIYKKYTKEGIGFKLRKWPLFGQWETRSDLMFFATIFSQTFYSMQDAVLKTKKTEAEIVSFLIASELAGIPIELKPVAVTDQAETQGVRKNISWIGKLRDKLHMKDYL